MHVIFCYFQIMLLRVYMAVFPVGWQKLWVTL